MMMRMMITRRGKRKNEYEGDTDSDYVDDDVVYIKTAGRLPSRGRLKPRRPGMTKA